MYGYSLDRANCVLHRVREVRSTPTGEVVFFRCPSNAYRAFPNFALTDDPTARKACGYCGIGVAEQVAPEVVYAGVRDGLVKVGCTTDLHTRLGAQKLTLAGQAPGSVPEEADLHRRMGTPARGREWFRWDGDAALLVTGWIVSRQKAVA